MTGSGWDKGALWSPWSQNDDGAATRGHNLMPGWDAAKGEISGGSERLDRPSSLDGALPRTLVNSCCTGARTRAGSRTGRRNSSASYRHLGDAPGRGEPGDLRDGP